MSRCEKCGQAFDPNPNAYRHRCLEDMTDEMFDKLIASKDAEIAELKASIEDYDDVAEILRLRKALAQCLKETDFPVNSFPLEEATASLSRIEQICEEALKK